MDGSQGLETTGLASASQEAVGHSPLSSATSSGTIEASAIDENGVVHDLKTWYEQTHSLTINGHDSFVSTMSKLHGIDDDEPSGVH